VLLRCGVSSCLRLTPMTVESRRTPESGLVRHKSYCAVARERDRGRTAYIWVGVFVHSQSDALCQACEYHNALSTSTTNSRAQHRLKLEPYGKRRKRKRTRLMSPARLYPTLGRPFKTHREMHVTDS
jgi:hypothetical protein